MRKFLSWENITEEQKSLFSFATALIILLALVIFAFIPLIEEALLAKKQSSKLHQELASYQELAQKRDYARIVANEKLQLQLLERRLPQNLIQAAVIEEVYSMAKLSNVKILVLKEIRQSSLKQGKALFNIKCNGFYEDILRFTQMLENEGGYKALTEVVLQGDELNGFLEVNGVVEAHFYKTSLSYLK